MADFTSLSADQVARLQAFMDSYRATQGRISQLLRQIQTLDDAWLGGIQEIVAKQLDAGTVLGVTTAMPGAAPLTSDSVITNMTNLEGALASFYQQANRQAYILAAGLQATT